MTDFTLAPRLEADTHLVLELPLSRVLLMDDARFPWLILVPRRPQIVELIDLPPEELHTLTDEIALASRALRALHAPDKLNVAALGNVVSQLHVHVVARRRLDAAWPAPVFGAGLPQPYPDGERGERLLELRRVFHELAPERRTR